jgi:hypothetical protein
MAKGTDRWIPLFGGLVAIITVFGGLATVEHFWKTAVLGPTDKVIDIHQRVPEPCTPTPSSIRRQLECAKMDLEPGRLAFEPKREMDQGKAERIFVRVSSQATADLGRGFKDGPPAIKVIRVGPVMRASLGFDAEDFAVRRLGDETKVVDKPYTEWAWEVTPLKAGDKTLEVSVYAKLTLPNGQAEQFEAFEGSAVVHVHTRPAYVVGKFMREYWQWLLGSPLVLGLCAWIWARFKKPEDKHRTGFQ